MDKKSLEKINKYHEDGEHDKIVETVKATPDYEKYSEALGLLARAYNNLDRYAEAEKILLSIEKECGEEFAYNFRLGYAQYYLGKFTKAKKSFEKANELDPDDEDTAWFLNSCNETIFRDKVAKKFEKAAVKSVAGEPVSHSFIERCDGFKSWFIKNEDKLLDMVKNGKKYESDKIIEFISKGLKPLCDNNEILFNIGGDNEFTFMPNGEAYLLYIMPRLTDAMTGLKNKWNFFPYPEGTKGKSFGIRMHEKEVEADKILLSVDYDVENDVYDISFYNETLNSLDENKAYSMFFTIFDIVLGDCLPRIYIGDINKADSLPAKAMPLTQVQKYIEDDVKKRKKELFKRMTDRVTAYGLTPDDSGEFRKDIISGIGSYMDLINDYYNGDDKNNYDKLVACGVKPVFIVFPYGEDDDIKAVLAFRHELEDKIEKEIFGEKGTGKELGLVLGGALGTACCYVDLLLFDEKAVFPKLQKLLSAYDYNFYLSEFRKKGELIRI